MSHHNTSSAFFPLVETPLHCNHHCNLTTLRVFGSLPAREAPGISSSRALVIKVSVNKYISNNAHAPWTVNNYVLIIHYEIMPLIGQVLGHLEKAGLRARKEKCQFFVPSATYLRRSQN